MSGEDLYALAPEDFTAARTAAVRQARADGDRAAATALGALRRPTASAHLVNLLVRRERALVDQLLDLGADLAAAQQAGSGDALRALGDQRRELVDALVRRAVALTGRDVPAAVRGEVAATLEAALADPAAGDAVQSGRLVRALSYAGFGGPDLDGAVAPGEVAGPAPDDPTGTADGAATATLDERAASPSRRAERGRAPRTERQQAERAKAEQARLVRDTERAAHAAAGALDDAVRACERATAEQTSAEQARADADRAVTEAERVLRAAREARHEAEQVKSAAQERAADHEAQVHAARDAAARAHAELDRLRRT